MSAKDHPNNAPGVPMVFPPPVHRLQVKYVNPVVKKVARFLPTFAMIEHRGRKSGKHYETVVNAHRKGTTVAVILGHGKADWVKTSWPPVRRTCISFDATCTSSIRGWCPRVRTTRACRRSPGAPRVG